MSERLNQERKGGIELIQAERERQQNVEGFDREHDKTHSNGAILRAALAYGWQAERQVGFGRTEVKPICDFPWGTKWWKPSTDPVCNLEKAAALIAAEIDRIVEERSRVKGTAELESAS